MKMFEIILDIGKVPRSISTSIADYLGLEQTFYPSPIHATKIREALAEQGYEKPSRYLLRGGFHSKEDLELVVTKGSDYQSRRITSSYPSRHQNGIFVSSLDYIGSPNHRIDPLWHALRGWNEVHILVVYDARQLELVRHKFKEYHFKHPRKKLQALLGIFHIEFTPVNQ